MDRARKSGASKMKCGKRSLTRCDRSREGQELRQGYSCLPG